MSRYKHQAAYYLALTSVFLLAAFFRYINTAWDNGYYLHPDERFLTMVSAAMEVPATFAQYLDANTSKFFPPNINFTFYVYGIFPLVINKFLGIWLGVDNYGGLGQLGRIVSATCDMLILLLVYRMALLLKKVLNVGTWFPVVATYFYAIAVLPIQLSHFFTVDMFLSLFMTATLYFCMLYAVHKKLLFVGLAAVMFGLAAASKVSSIYMVPLYIFVIYLGCLPSIQSSINREKKGARLSFKFFLNYLHGFQKTFISKKTILYLGLCGIIFISVSYTVLRLADPYYFQTPNFFDITPNEKFMENIEQLKGFNTTEGYFPPAIQWMTKPPIIYSLTNITMFGLGIPYMFFLCMGMYLLARRRLTLLIAGLLLWSIGYFIFHSVSFVKVMRYTIFVYPLFALFAAYGFYTFFRAKKIWLTISAGVVLLIWPLMYMNIYMNTNSRVAATYWIYDNLPDQSFILSEHWDDSMPLLLPLPKQFPGEQLEVFGPDTPEKFEKINEQMAKGDYYIMSSNRAWGTIPTVPEKYPEMTKFYADMFAEKKGYVKIKEFTSYPSLQWLGIPLTMPDDWAEESFTVYDHPKVMIFKNESK